MAELPRSPDFLRVTASNARRLRNLETGVHPTGVNLEYYDSYPEAVIPLRSGWMRYEEGTAFATPFWQRRVGIVSLFGGVMPTPNWAGKGTLSIVGDLPEAARPRFDQ